MATEEFGNSGRQTIEFVGIDLDYQLVVRFPNVGWEGPGYLHAGRGEGSKLLIQLSSKRFCASPRFVAVEGYRKRYRPVTHSQHPL
jgi:hypothetical protein